jgi:hypothetical protein
MVQSARQQPFQPLAQVNKRGSQGPRNKEKS